MKHSTGVDLDQLYRSSRALNRESSPNTSGDSAKVTSIVIGGGTRLVLFDDLHARFAPFGYTKPLFLNFLRALGCAPLHTPDGRILVNLLSFQLAVNAATRIGQPDFLSPGHKRIWKNPPRNSTRGLNPKYFNENWKQLVSELLAARALNYNLNTPEIRASFEAAAQKIASQLSLLTVGAHVSALPKENSKLDEPFRDCAPTVL